MSMRKLSCWTWFQTKCGVSWLISITAKKLCTTTRWHHSGCLIASNGCLGTWSESRLNGCLKLSPVIFRRTKNGGKIIVYLWLDWLTTTHSTVARFAHLHLGIGSIGRSFNGPIHFLRI